VADLFEERPGIKPCVVFGFYGQTPLSSLGKVLCGYVTVDAITPIPGKKLHELTCGRQALPPRLGSGLRENLWLPESPARTACGATIVARDNGDAQRT
jgi:hypothetical protein